MIRLLLLTFFVSVLFACTKPTGINALVKTSDSVAINFFKGDGSMDSVVKVVILRDKKQVQQLGDYIESSTTKEFKCGYDGSFHFFKRDVVLKDVDFRMNDAQCMHFSFVIDNNIYSTQLSAEAKTFLESIKKQ